MALILKKYLLIYLILSLFTHARISAQISDTIEILPAWHQSNAASLLVVPSILIGAGIATIHDNGYYSSHDAYECIQRHYTDFHTNVDDYLRFMPAAGVFSLNIAGVEGKNNLTDCSLIYLISISLASITNSTIKRTTGIMRPDGSDYLSFPSGHTVTAFVSATFLHEEYKHQSIWFGIAGYSAATATGVLRMLNNRHWMSDVLVGAGLGILMTKAVYLIYPVVKDKFYTRDKNNGGNGLTLVPHLYPDHYGMYLSYTFN